MDGRGSPRHLLEKTRTMVSEQIEKIKQEYTDKYVVADANRPELARFRDHVGQVKTVNMSGRALVEFIDYHQNIGWFDIDLDYLKVVDKPAPKEKAPAATKPAPAAKKQAPVTGEKKLSPLEMARMQDAAGKGGAAAPAPAKKQAAAADEPAKADRSKMSVAEMLAAARAEKSGDAPPASAPAEEAPSAEPEPAAAEPVAESSTGDSAKVDRSSMSIADMIAYCREKDAS
ncbi:MAG: hypothetical protein IH831_04725 [Planctomycetes bacterium]|nr:hypothetical protein [Planctomycetota bacterium]